jgi:acetyl esterase/lipase
MPSFKSHLFAFILKNTRKKAFRSADGLHAWIRKSRPKQDHRPPARIAARLAIETLQTGGFPVYDVRPKSGGKARRLLYLHGGAYCFEMTPFHWNLVAELAEQLDAHVTVPIYPLAPEHQFDAIYAMVRRVYQEVAAEGREFLIAGDSAGGNMAMVLTMMAAQDGWPLANRLALISPSVDMTLTNPKTREAARRDPWLDIDGGRESVRIYAGGLEFSDWRISPAHGDLACLPPTLVFSGTRDLLYPDTQDFAARAGDKVNLITGHGMIHVWPLLPIPEAKAARERMVAFLAA